MKFKATIKSFLDTLPYIKRLKKYETYWEPGHYYSAIPDNDYLEKNQERIFENNKSIAAIDMRDEEQKEFLENIYPFICECPFQNKEKIEKYRFFNENGSYGFGDSDILFAAIRLYKPRQIIEVGSGYSSALMMDTNELFFSNSINITFIEPYPTRLNAVLRDEDRRRYKIVENIVQNVELDTFRELKENDILFIDSSHVLKTGSDLEYIIFEILPNLQKGVVIHFHDIFNNFQYLKEHYTKKGFGWDECYMLHAFLMYNKAFEIRFFTNYFDNHFKTLLQEKYPKYKILTAGSFWMQKIQ